MALPTNLLRALGEVLSFLLSFTRRLIRKKEQSNAQENSDSVHSNPAASFNEHFRLREGVSGAEDTDETSDSS